jgi:hypothetical protein
MPHPFLPKKVPHVSKIFRNQGEASVVWQIVACVGILIHAVDVSVLAERIKHQLCVSAASKCGVDKCATCVITDSESFEARRGEDWDVVCRGIHGSILV